MSQENVEVVRRWWDGLAHGELRLECCDRDIEVRNLVEGPDTGLYLGHDGVRLWWEQITDAFEDLKVELLELIDVDDQRVVSVQRYTAKFRHTGIDFDFLWGSVLFLNEGRMISAVGYVSPGEAKRAAGLNK